MVQIAIVDDNDMLRQAVMQKLEEGFSVLYEASSGASLLRYLRGNAPAQHPQVILMDIAMEGMDGIETTAWVKEINPAIKVVMLTVFEDEDKVLSAIKVGADGYCIKDEKRERLVTCIYDVLEGGSYMSPVVARKAMRYLQQSYLPPAPGNTNPLSKREQEILQLVINGKSYQHIADDLFISLSTVKTHIYNIYEKLHVSNKMEAARVVMDKRWM